MGRALREDHILQSVLARMPLHDGPEGIGTCPLSGRHLPETVQSPYGHC